MSPYLVLILAMAITNESASDEWPPKVWTQPCESFHMAGPVYYVGSRELSAYLVVDDAGMVLINIGMQENVPLVMASIKKLGFKPQNLRYLLITQAHMDHAGGAAQLARLTGAVVCAGKKDIPLLRDGGKGDYVFGDDLPFDPVAKPMGLTHGQQIKLGKLTLQTIATPGHTPGGSSWLLTWPTKTQPIQFLFQGSISVLGDAQLIDNPTYPTVVADFRTSIQRLEVLSPNYICPDHLVFVHPKGVTHQDAPKLEWFQNRDILAKQITRTRKALDRHLQKQ